jgi:non-ribosomal peptide synthase protein (TIGR01720 family)
VHRAYGTQVNDLLLAALLQALGEWAGTTSVALDLESHGREAVAPGTDLSRTVGWFTSVYPVVLDHDDLAEPAGLIAAVRDQLRAAPRRGVGYGALRHLAGDADPGVRRLRAAPDRQVNVNYAGAYDAVADDAVGLIADELPGELCGPATSDGQRPYALHLEIERTGDGGLLIEWHYSTNLHRRPTVERVAARHVRALEDLIDHCRSLRK